MPDPIIIGDEGEAERLFGDKKSKSKLAQAWEVIREDWSNNRFRVPLPDGRKLMSEEEAKDYARHMQDKGHHQDYEARPYEADDPDIMDW